MKCAHAISHMQMSGSGLDVDSICDMRFGSEIKTFLLDPSQFVAGNIRRHLLAMVLAAAAVRWIGRSCWVCFCSVFLKCSKGILILLTACNY